MANLSDLFWRRPKVLLLAMLLPAVLWLGIIYVGSLIALLVQSFFSIDEFSGLIKYELTLKTYLELLRPANLDIIVRTVTMAACVTMAAAIVAFPIAFYAARYAKGRWKAIFYVGIMLPLWSSYLVKVYAWKLILAKEGILNWLLAKLTFLVFLYVWLPFMVLPMQAALERVPASYLEASADLGAKPSKTFWNVIFPLALPGVIAGSIFTFSTAGNIPLAAAFTVVPIVIMVFYLWFAKRKGAFDAL